MDANAFLLDIAIILFFTKLLGLATRKLNLPQVVGALLAGVLLGPAFLGVLEETESIYMLSQLGVIVMMFSAGLETDIKQLKYTGKAAFIIACFGVFLPLVGGFAVASIFNPGGSYEAILQNVFIGVILTATSVSITVGTLKELGKISTKVGSTILAAALIDDILGIIVLTIVTSLAGSGVSIFMVLIKILGFFAFSAAIGFITHKVFTKWVNRYTRDLRRFVIISFVMCLVLSVVAEEVFGVASITGAFIAGLIITNTSHTHYIESRFETLAYILLTPIFFVSIGLKMEMPEFTFQVVAFTLSVVVIAILTKIIGCYIAGRLCKFNSAESFQIGSGMVARGEVALIIATSGEPLGLFKDEFYTPIILMVIAASIIAPILLKIAFKKS
ncbi:MAG: cation:proton antiporter [Clostridia bacterium]